MLADLLVGACGLSVVGFLNSVIGRAAVGDASGLLWSVRRGEAALVGVT